MAVVILLAAAVILGGVVVVAMGRGGELARERPDLPVHSDFRNWSDVAQYRPPAALLGYHAQATEHALSLIARTIAERDAEIDWLRKRLAEARPESGADDSGRIRLAGMTDRSDGPGRDFAGGDFAGDDFAGDDFAGDRGLTGDRVLPGAGWQTGVADPAAARAAYPAQQGLGGHAGEDE